MKTPAAIVQAAFGNLIAHNNVTTHTPTNGAGIDVAAIAAGPISKQSGTNAFRPVVVVTDEQPPRLIGYTEYFPDYEENDPNLSTGHYSSGSYFGAVSQTTIYKAFRWLGEKIVDQSGSVSSIAKDAQHDPFL